VTGLEAEWDYFFEVLEKQLCLLEAPIRANAFDTFEN